jgi:hypothetical protein
MSSRLSSARGGSSCANEYLPRPHGHTVGGVSARERKPLRAAHRSAPERGCSPATKTSWSMFPTPCWVREAAGHAAHAPLKRRKRFAGCVRGDNRFNGALPQEARCWCGSRDGSGCSSRELLTIISTTTRSITQGYRSGSSARKSQCSIYMLYPFARSDDFDLDLSFGTG